MGDACSQDNLMSTLLGATESEGFALPSRPGFEPSTLDNQFYFQKQYVAPFKSLQQAAAADARIELPPAIADVKIEKFPEMLEKVTAQDASVTPVKPKKGETGLATSVGEYIFGHRDPKGVKGIFGNDYTDSTWRSRHNDVPSRILGDKIYEPIAEEIRDLHRQFGSEKSAEFQRAYKDTVARKAKAERQNLENMVRFAKNVDELGEAVGTRYGIPRQRIADLHEWLDYLSRPNDFQQQGSTPFHRVFDNALESMTKRTAPYRLTWIIGNLGDASRIVSAYASKPKGMTAVMQGIADTFDGGIVGSVSKSKQLELDGMYDLNRGYETDAIPLDENNLFSWTNNFQINLANNIGNRFDGNGKKAVQDLAFHHEWFNQSSQMRNMKDNTFRNLSFGLMRYVINENIWYYNQARWMFSSDKEVQKSAIKSMVGYSALRGAVFGSMAAVPLPVSFVLNPAYEAIFGENLEDATARLDRSLPTNLAGKAVGGAVNAAAGLAGMRDAGRYEVNLGTWAQPLGGSVLVRANQLMTLGEGVVGRVTKAQKGGYAGRLDDAAIDATAAALSFLMLANKGSPYLVNDLTSRFMRKFSTEYQGQQRYTKALLESLAPGAVQEVK